MGTPLLMGVGGFTKASKFISATGGTVTTDGNYKIHTISSTDILKITDIGDGSQTAWFLLIAGGAGACFNGNGTGGGGAGGYIENTLWSPTLGNFPISIGGGGIKGLGSQAADPINKQNTNGGDSIFSGFVAVGGGRGGDSVSTGSPGSGGGSGGGGGSMGDQSGGSPIAGQGFSGGSGMGSGSPLRGGGGGGAIQAGATSNGGTGNGGNGLTSLISGASIIYCGGGGGGGGAWSLAGGINGGDGGAGGGGVFIFRYQFQ